MHNNALIIYQIWVTGNQRDGALAGLRQQVHPGRFHHLAAGDHISERAVLGDDDDLIAFLELVQVAEDFAEDIVMGSEDQVAGLAWVGRANVLAHAFLELFPVVALHDGTVHADGLDHDPRRLLRPLRRKRLRRDGLRLILESEDDFEVVGEAANGAEAVRLCAELNPQVVLMDLRMPGMGGVEATRRLMAAHPGAVVVMLNPDKSESQVTYTTSSTGYYRLWSIPHGDRTIVIRKAATDEFGFDKKTISMSFNEIEDPLRIPAGTILDIPPLSELEHLL